MPVSPQLFGQSLKRLREARGLTQKALAERVDVTTTYVSMLECGRKEASPQVLRAISDALKVPEECLTILGIQPPRRSKSMPEGMPETVKALQASIFALVETDQE